MRLFYDVRTNRRSGELLAAGADVAALAGAAFHATGAAHGSLVDVLLLALWAAIPRAFAPLAAAAMHSHGAPRTAHYPVAVFLTVAVLLVSGNEILRGATSGEPLGISLLLVLFLAWGSGFLLGLPRAHKLHEAFVLATVLLALKDSRPLPLLWTPFTCGSLIFSAAIRRALAGSSTAHRAAPFFNLQNARAVACVATGLVASVFLVIALAAWREPPARTRLPERRPLAKGAPGASDAGARKKERAEPDGAGGTTGVPAAAPGAGGEGDAAGRRVGLSYRVPLRRLGAVLRDDRIVLRARGAGRSAIPRSLSTGILWKAITLSRYDPAREDWSEATLWETRPWPENRRLARPTALPAGEQTARLAVEVVTPLVRTFVAPYGTREIRGDGFSSYSENALGDVRPEPPLAQQARYQLEVVLGDGAAVPADMAALETKEDGAVTRPFLEVPSAEEAGMDLRSLAQRVFRGAATPAARIAALRAHFAREFRYANAAAWRGEQPLRSFLLEAKVGNCAYFATAAALLLRAGGVHSRIAAGFGASEWNAERAELTIRGRMAHAWIEVLLDGAWRAFDPATWARPDPSYVPPPEALSALPPAAGGQSLDDTFVAESGPGAFPDPLPAPRPSGSSTGAASEPSGGREAPSGAAEDPARRPRDGGLPSGAPWTPGTEDGGSWLESTEVLLSGPAREASGENGPGLALSADEASSRGSREGLAARRTGPGGGDREAAFRLLFRVVFVIAAAAILAILVRRLFRPPAEEEEEEAADPQAASQPSATSRPDFLHLDEAIPRDRVLAEYLRLQVSLERTRNHRRLHQTPEEHACRVARGDEELTASFGDLNGILYDLLYGARAVGEDEATVAAESCRRIRRRLG